MVDDPIPGYGLTVAQLGFVYRAVDTLDPITAFREAYGLPDHVTDEETGILAIAMLDLPEVRAEYDRLLGALEMARKDLHLSAGGGVH